MIMLLFRHPKGEPRYAAAVNVFPAGFFVYPYN